MQFFSEQLWRFVEESGVETTKLENKYLSEKGEMWEFQIYGWTLDRKCKDDIQIVCDSPLMVDIDDSSRCCEKNSPDDSICKEETAVCKLPLIQDPENEFRCCEEDLDLGPNESITKVL